MNTKSKFGCPPLLGASRGRARTTDIAFTFRMNAGFPGDVNRGHPASIQPCLIDVNAPPTGFGQAVLVDPTTQGVRPIVAGDSAITEIWGVTVRPYPFQQATTSLQYGAVGIGAGSPASAQPIDVLRGGYIMVTVVGAPVKGTAVYIWYGTTAGGHTLGGFEAVSGATTIALDPARYSWNSPADPTGVAELVVNF